MNLREPIAWGLKSVGGLLLNLALLTVWVEYVGLSPEIAIFPNWVLISLLGYVFTDRVVFAEAVSPVGLLANARRYLSMQGVMVVSKTANYAIYLGLMWLGVPYQLAWAVGAVVTFGVSFIGNRRLWNGGIGS